MRPQTEPTRCAGRLRYRDSHTRADRWWVVYAPDGRRLACCSTECLLEVICEPPAYEETRRYRHLEVVR